MLRHPRIRFRSLLAAAKGDTMLRLLSLALTVFLVAVTKSALAAPPSGSNWVTSAQSSPVSATTQQSGGSVMLGDNTVLPSNDSDNGDHLLANPATLSQTGTVQSLSFYIGTAAGNLRLGSYDASGPG